MSLMYFMQQKVLQLLLSEKRLTGALVGKFTFVREKVNWCTCREICCIFKGPVNFSSLGSLSCPGVLLNNNYFRSMR